MGLNKWAILKRHLALPLAVIAILLIAIILDDVRGAKEQGTFEIEHLQGDSSVLDDVTINGVIVDANHRTSFAWQGSEVSKETKVYPYARMEWRYNYGYGFYKRIGEHYYSLHGNNWGQDFSITRQEFRSNRMTNYEIATASIPVRQIVYKENTAQYTNQQDYGLASVGEDVFFAVPTTRGYKGTNGIYKLAFDPTPPYIDPNDRAQSSPIMTFSLDANEEKGAAGIEVLGLESVGDKLALILVKDGMLVIEGYSTSGDRLGEARVSPFTLAGREQQAEDGIHHYEPYEVYSNDAEETLTLSFLSNSSLRHRTVISIDFTKEVELVDVTAISMMNEWLREDRDYEHGARFISYIDGRLYYAGLFREAEDPAANYVSFNTPMRFLVYVYQQGELVYQGELHTDINDDLIRIDKSDPHGYSYDTLEHRNLYDVHID